MSSGFNSPNPFGHQNPYSSPQQPPIGGPPGYPGHDYVQAAKSKVMPAAIALIALASLGIALSIFNVVFALVSPPPVVDPNAPPFVQEFQKGAVGPGTAIVQVIFVFVNVAILGGGIQMLRLQMRPYAITAAILAMLNFGSCCCIGGIPVGIWSLIVLSMADVAAAFDRR